jgi:enhancing lycopene biosynthesis protein 2
MTRRIAVLLSGCGALDGSDIHEAVLTLLALDRAGVEIVCTAPDIDQFHVINHLTNEESAEVRNVLVESSRIARGNVVALDALDPQKIDGLILPGGFGAVKSLCTFALKGPQGDVNPQVLELLRRVHEEKKPIGAVCISPATIVMTLKGCQPSVTIGTDAGAVAAIHTMGGEHHACKVDEIYVDPVNRIVSTPGYMLGTEIKEIAAGIEKLVQKVIELAE